MNEFDFVARHYDRLAKLVFGKAIVNSQLQYLSQIPKSGKILVLGGGTGWWLNNPALQNKNLEIWFVEASKEMIKRAQQNVAAGLSIHFIHGTSLNLNLTAHFDAVVTFFFLDVFEQNNLKNEIQKIIALAKPGALWLVTDFVHKSWWHGFLLSLMYRFFGIVSSLSTRTLPDWQGELQRNGIAEKDTAYFYRGFIKASLYVA